MSDAGAGAAAADSPPATSAPSRQLPYDSVLFFHGLNGLELACENGKVPPGTCALFNGASMLLLANPDKLAGKILWEGDKPPFESDPG